MQVREEQIFLGLVLLFELLIDFVSVVFDLIICDFMYLVALVGSRVVF